MIHDRTSSAIGEYAASLRSEDLNDFLAQTFVRHHLDAVGCALGGFNTEPCKIVRRFADSVRSDIGCTVFGLSEGVAPEQAVFANVTMLRQLDLNDATIGGGHPSDIVPAVYAAAELVGASGKDVIRGSFIGYEVQAALYEAGSIGLAGLDQGVYVAISAASAVGSVFGLSADEIANAVAIAMTPSMALLTTRHGELSNWKGSATAYGVMHGLFAARLAREGMTGSESPFDGEYGFYRHVVRKQELSIGEPKDGRSAIERAIFKYHPAVIHAQPLITPLANVRDQIRVEDITKISIETYKRSWQMVGGGFDDHEEKWHPQSRETADHSLAYITALTLLDGDITQDSYSEERLADPSVHRLMEMTTVSPRDDLTELFPGEQRTEIHLELGGRDVLTVHSGYPVGHLKNPITDEQLSSKFRQMSAGVLSKESSDELESVLWDFADLADLDRLSKFYRAI